MLHMLAVLLDLETLKVVTPVFVQGGLCERGIDKL